MLFDLPLRGVKTPWLAWRARVAPGANVARLRAGAAHQGSFTTVNQKPSTAWTMD